MVPLNQPASGKAGIASLLAIGRCCPGLPEPGRSPFIRAQRANLKSRSDDLMVAQQARNERRPGLRIKMISSLFSSGLARSRRAKPEENKEVGCGGSLPRTAASAALSWATISPPPWGSGKANQRAALDAAVAFCLYSEAPRRRASEPERSAYAL